jgi:glycerophosphoryl diester phosphodiesterase
VTALRLAHRGDWRHAPENSLGAIAAALRVPACDGLEFDVRHSLDGVPILLHDPTLARVQGLAVVAADLTAAELEPLGVPSLAAVLVAAGRGPFLDIELKEPRSEAALDLIRAARGTSDGGLERAVVSSFELDILGAVARTHPGWPRWLNTHHLASVTVDRAIELGCVGIGAEWHTIDVRAAAHILDAGLDLAAFTVRRRATFERLSNLGVSAMCVEASALDG